jgi:hypothetical protein
VYAALKKETNINKNIEICDHPNTLLIRPISPTKFNEGGAAIFLEHNKNHHIDILGIKLSMPLLINNLRLPNRS